jgi:hypothetical protein
LTVPGRNGNEFSVILLTERDLREVAHAFFSRKKLELTGVFPKATLGAKERSSLVLVLILVLDLFGNSITRMRTSNEEDVTFSAF